MLNLKRKKQQNEGGLFPRFSVPIGYLWHNHDTLGVYGTHVGILTQGCHVIFCGLLQGHDGMHLESETIGPLPIGELCAGVKNGACR